LQPDTNGGRSGEILLGENRPVLILLKAAQRELCEKPPMPFLFRCPNTGFQVQGWAADDGSEDDRATYEGVTCLACRGLHMVNPKTGAVLGSDDE
jgi:hypothetical protein